MPLVVNWASTWANQTSGSAGQKGGSLMLTAATAGTGAAGGSGAGGSSIDISCVAGLRSRRGHQCRGCHEQEKLNYIEDGVRHIYIYPDHVVIRMF